MNEKHKKIAKLLWDFNSLREEHIIKMCDCDKTDIDYLIANNVLLRDNNTKIIRYKTKETNNRNVAAFDVVMNFLDRDPKISKGRFPVNVTMKMKYTTYDIIAIKEEEIEKLYNDIDIISKSDKIIVVIETHNYIKRKINTSRPYSICIFPPLKIKEIKK